ncbi:MAG: DNA-processing protein DprA [Bacillus sp. (in: Bacteria)]|nr:DNA-processing protein DprA [Bacillus sp. (in: firmicutes)]
MNKKINRLLKLHYCCQGDFQTVKKFYEYDPNFETYEYLSEYDLQTKVKIPPKKSAQLSQLFQSVKIENLNQMYKQKGIQCITVFHDAYPELLKSIYDPPWVLYCKGNGELLNHKPTLSVVGTRHPSNLALHELNVILAPLVLQGFVIVSGAALGIDKMAHEIAMKYIGKTIAVLGYGLDWVYPKSNEGVLKQMKEGQLLVTEYPPYVRPQKWFFPQRNRIISGLTQATFVVEAKEQSGSLITCDLALQQGRNVLAMPGRISDEESKGTNQLIQQGAKLVLSANDILEEYLF